MTMMFNNVEDQANNIVSTKSWKLRPSPLGLSFLHGEMLRLDPKISEVPQASYFSGGLSSPGKVS